MRRVITGLFIVGQWLLPITWWVAFGTGRPALLGTMFLWGPALVVAMGLMAWQVATGGARFPDRPVEPTSDSPVLVATVECEDSVLRK